MNELRAKSATVSTDGTPTLTIDLVGGTTITFPLSRIKSFTPARIRKAGPDLFDVRVRHRGLTIEWPALGDDFNVPEMVPEYLGITTARAAARKAGSTTSEAKRAASAANGARGGRPRKVLVTA